MFPQFPQTLHLPAYFRRSPRKKTSERRERAREGRREEVDLRVGLAGCQAGGGRGGEARSDEVSGKLKGREGGWGGGRGLSPRPSELIGTAVLFYPPTECVVFGRHTSRRPASELSRPVPPRQRGASLPPPPLLPPRPPPPPPLLLHTHTHTLGTLTPQPPRLTLNPPRFRQSSTWDSLC